MGVIVIWLNNSKLVGRLQKTDPVEDQILDMLGVEKRQSFIAVLSWLWPVLETYPDVAATLYEEIDRVVGAGPIQRAHVGELQYTRMVLDELESG